MRWNLLLVSATPASHYTLRSCARPHGCKIWFSPRRRRKHFSLNSKSSISLAHYHDLYRDDVMKKHHFRHLLWLRADRVGHNISYVVSVHIIMRASLGGKKCRFPVIVACELRRHICHLEILLTGHFRNDTTMVVLIWVTATTTSNNKMSLRNVTVETRSI